ncbi:hypothetical protein RA276_27475 [Pseudomonas syringae pv. tagetis]|uniref:hypothetical protein n=1 Tax=Pseudomonas syringae group genomosp. 7 TaxID=251699 RepID=UPI0037701CC4
MLWWLWGVVLWVLGLWLCGGFFGLLGGCGVVWWGFGCGCGGVGVGVVVWVLLGCWCFVCCGVVGVFGILLWIGWGVGVRRLLVVVCVGGVFGGRLCGLWSGSLWLWGLGGVFWASLGGCGLGLWWGGGWWSCEGVLWWWGGLVWWFGLVLLWVVVVGLLLVGVCLGFGWCRGVGGVVVGGVAVGGVCGGLWGVWVGVEILVGGEGLEWVCFYGVVGVGGLVGCGFVGCGVVVVGCVVVGVCVGWWWGVWWLLGGFL